MKYGTYKGKNIEEMTREELMEALATMGNLYSKEIEEKLKLYDNTILKTKMP